MPDNTTLFTEQHKICLAYKERVYKDKSDTWVFSMLCDSFSLDPDSDDADTLEKHLIGYFQQQGLVFEYSEELLTVVTEGKMQLLLTEVVIESKEIGNVQLFHAIQLVVNNKVRAQTHDLSVKDTILNAFQDLFPDRTIKDLELLSYYDRIETVMRAYHALHPRDGLKAVISACQKACPDINFTNESQRPEFIGEAYMNYLLQMLEEKRERQYIMSLSRYIETGKYMDYNKEEATVNLWEQPSHHQAYDVFVTAQMYQSEVSQNSKQGVGKVNRRKKAKPGNGNGNGQKNTGKSPDGAEPVDV